MLIVGNNRLSNLNVCLEAAPNFRLSKPQAEKVIKNQLAAIKKHWPYLAEEAALSPIEKNLMWRRQLLNPFIFEGAPKSIAQFDTDD